MGGLIRRGKDVRGRTARGLVARWLPSREAPLRVVEVARRLKVHPELRRRREDARKQEAEEGSRLPSLQPRAIEKQSRLDESEARSPENQASSRRETLPSRSETARADKSPSASRKKSSAVGTDRSCAASETSAAHCFLGSSITTRVPSRHGPSYPCSYGLTQVSFPTHRPRRVGAWGSRLRLKREPGSNPGAAPQR